MASKTWENLRLANRPEDEVWELFHENSRTSLYDSSPTPEEIVRRMMETEECLPYDQYPVVPLPEVRARLPLSLEQAITSRVSAKVLRPRTLRLDELASVLHFAYGITRSNVGTAYPRPFRAVPSGGAMYPLEIYLQSNHLEEQSPGLYHYNPSRNELRLLQQGDQAPLIAKGLAHFQRDLAFDASAIFFLTAAFERSTFKYGARGYRFVLLEAGHVAQNISLVATALGLGCVCLGGYHDRRINDLLNLDGVTQATVYMVALGEKLADPNSAGVP